MMLATTEQVPLFAHAPVCACSEFDVHAISIPARTFTGDFWFTHRADDRLWFALGDVAGKGLPAALVMAMIQEELEQRVTSCARAGCDPATTMQRLHTLLRPLLPANRFATAVIGWVRDDGKVKLVNGGHCSPLILKKDGSLRAIESTGPVVGILPVARWKSATFTLDEGDVLLLYSDGVIEATSYEGLEFGVGGIEMALKSPSPLPLSPRGGERGPAQAVVAAVLSAVQSHAVVSDDLTLLAIAR